MERIWHHNFDLYSSHSMATPMMFLFDVDGTLTPSRGVIDKDFADWLTDFVKHNTVAWVTGSDAVKTQEQIGHDLWSSAWYSFNCSGNEIYQNGQLIYATDWRCPPDLETWLQKKLWQSPYRYRAGNHVEHRTGMVNFSVVGRNAGPVERKEYFIWDQDTKERQNLAKEINANWPDIQASVGGEISIDIFQRGHDKSQVTPWLGDGHNLVFFGDRMDPAGNDFSLAQRVLQRPGGQCYHVKGWQETYNILKRTFHV